MKTVKVLLAVGFTVILALAVYKGGVDERFDSRPSYNNSQYDNALEREFTEQRLRKLEQQADYDRQTREMEWRWWK